MLLYIPVLQLKTPPQMMAIVVVPVLFGLAEVFVAHIEVRGQAHTFSLVELPLVLGLLFLRPALLVPAHLAAAALALVLYRRQQPAKLLVNLAAFALEDSLALLVFHGLAANGNPLRQRTWLSITAATVLASVTAVLVVTLAIRLSGQRQPRKETAVSLGLGVAITLVTTSTGLAFVVLAKTDSSATVLLLLPTVATYVAQRSTVQRRQGQRTLQFLRLSTGVINKTRDQSAAARHLLALAREQFQADVVALTYVAASDPDAALLIRIGPGNEEPENLAIDRGTEWPLWMQLAAPQGRLVSAARDPLDLLLPGITVRDGIIVPLTVGERSVGYMFVGNRLSDVSRFSASDVGLLTTVANDLAIGIEDGQLDQPAHHMRVLERQLAYRADHDAETGLFSHTAYLDRAGQRLAAAPSGVLALLVSVTAVGPEPMWPALSLVIAERLKRCLRGEDVAARIDQCRFAVLASAAEITRLALIMEDRLRRVLAQPIYLDGIPIPVLLSTTSTVAHSLEDLERLLPGTAR